MSSRLAWSAVVIVCLCRFAAAQTAMPELSRQQREQLLSLVTAADTARAQPESDGDVRLHVMRASDGSHYVAFTIAPGVAVTGQTAIYVRLATAGTPRPERSPLRDWLTTNQQASAPHFAKRGIAIGDMPVMGPTGSLDKRPPTTPEMASLAILELDRRRARERDEARDRQRRAELEGKAAIPVDDLPFEDFEFPTAPPGARIQRALTSGPGDFFLYVAWANADSPKPTTTVFKKRVTLPSASASDLTIGSVILADGIQTRPKPYLPHEQASHPYAIGTTEIIPAADTVYRDDEQLSTVFQVINPAPGEHGKPNVDVIFQVVRLEGAREVPVAALTPQNYSIKNLPAEFDLRVGHPLFATVSAPLSTLRRGNYRLKILVNDSVGGRTATADVDFSVTATAVALLRDAPPLGVPFRVESVLSPDVVRGVLASLRPVSPSPALQRAFDLAAAGKYVELMVDEPVPAPEEGARAALRGLAQLAVGDGSAALQFQRAQLLGVPGPSRDAGSTATLRFLSGAARALQLRDADAIAAWQEALKTGGPATLVVPQLVDAFLRRNEPQRAAALLTGVKTAEWSRGTAAVFIATERETEAIAMLDARLNQAPGDADAQWLLLHALYSRTVRASDQSTRARFQNQARAYIDANGAHAKLAAEWLAAIQ